MVYMPEGPVRLSNRNNRYFLLETVKKCMETILVARPHKEYNADAIDTGHCGSGTAYIPEVSLCVVYMPEVFAFGFINPNDSVTESVFTLASF